MQLSVELMMASGRHCSGERRSRFMSSISSSSSSVRRTTIVGGWRSPGAGFGRILGLDEVCSVVDNDGLQRSWRQQHLRIIPLLQQLHCGVLASLVAATQSCRLLVRRWPRRRRLPRQGLGSYGRRSQNEQRGLVQDDDRWFRLRIRSIRCRDGRPRCRRSRNGDGTGGASFDGGSVVIATSVDDVVCLQRSFVSKEFV